MISPCLDQERTPGLRRALVTDHGDETGARESERALLRRAPLSFCVGNHPDETSAQGSEELRLLDPVEARRS
jgi:hypothetical protein